MKKTLLALCVSVALTAPAFAATPVSQSQIQALEARIKALEANDEALRQQVAAASAALDATRAELEAMKAASTPELASVPANAEPLAEQTSEPASEPTAAPESANGNAFNPAISIILNGSYSDHSLDPDVYQRSGFPLVGEGVPSAQGFSLGESEISFAANIDERFYGQLTWRSAVDDGETELAVEEAFIDTTALPGGLTLRAGRFFRTSAISTATTRIPTSSSTARWPTRPSSAISTATTACSCAGSRRPTCSSNSAARLFRGQNYPRAARRHDGADVGTLFAHAGGDVGDENSWLAGVSMLKSNTNGAEDGFSGDSTLYVADATWKWAPRRQLQGWRRDGARRIFPRSIAMASTPIRSIPRFDQRLDRQQRRGAYVEGDLSDQPHLGNRLPLRPSVGRRQRSVRERLQPGSPQRRC